MASEINPDVLPPRERAARAIELVQSGALHEVDGRDLIKFLRDAFLYIRTGRMVFPSNEAVWQFTWQVADEILASYRSLQEHRFEVHKPGQRIETLDEYLATGGTLVGVDLHNVGRVAAVMVERIAPELLDVVPEEYRTAEPGIGFSPVELREIVREELKTARLPPGALQVRPEEFRSLEEELARERAEAPSIGPPPTPEVEAAEIAKPPVAPLPANPQFPPASVVATYGRRELEAMFRVWTRLKDQGILPPPDVLAAAQTRWQSVFHFAPPQDFHRPGAAPAAPPPPIPPPPMVREYVEERIHTGPEGEHREVVRGVETAPVPLPPGVELKMPSFDVRIYEKYRPRVLQDVVGHRRILAQLEQMVSSNNYPACLFFWGTPGTGKSSTASAFELLPVPGVPQKKRHAG